MNEQKTVKVDTGVPDNAGGSTVYSGQGSGNYGGSWEQTQYAGSDRPTPRPGEVPAWQPQPPMPQQGPWGAPGPTPGGAQTMMIGPKVEPPFAWLVVVSSPGPNPYLGQPVPLKAGGTSTVGRVPGNDIIVPDPSCSSQHAKVRQEPDENGKQVFVIYDLASSNGLFVGVKETYKDPASRAYRHVLKDGDYILIGETTLVFKQV
jgi:hypothetical protein